MQHFNSARVVKFPEHDVNWYSTETLPRILRQMLHILSWFIVTKVHVP